MALPNPVGVSYFLLLPWINADCFHLLQRKFSGAAALASVTGAMQNLVSFVIGARIPTKVTKAIIEWVSVVVASLMPDRLRSYECRKHQAVRLHIKTFVSFPEKQERSHPSVIDGLTLDASGFYRFYSSTVRNFVQTFKANNGQPLFHICLWYHK